MPEADFTIRTPLFFFFVFSIAQQAVHQTVMVSDGLREERLFHATSARSSLRTSVICCPFRSAASWHWTQSEAQGKAAMRFGLSGDSHSRQIPKLPS
jgi:hypothetical protein